MIQQVLTTSFKQQLLLGQHNFAASGGNAFKIALYLDTATLNSSTTVYSATGETSGAGYTAGGLALTNIDPTSYGTVAYTSFSTVTWNSSNFSARGALIYNTSSSNKSVMVLDFGLTRQSLSNGVFQITWPLMNVQYAIIRIN